MARRANPFDWSGGDPALDFVNTLDERLSGAPVENLATYGDLVRFAELAGLIEPSTSVRLRSLEGPDCSRIARRARELREHLHALLAAAQLGQTVPKSLIGCNRIRSASGSRCAKSSSQRQHRALSGTVGSRHPHRKFRCTPARSQSKLCLSRPITVVSESAAHPTATSISSIQARRIDGSGAACRTAAIAKNKGVGVQAQLHDARRCLIYEMPRRSLSSGRPLRAGPVGGA